LPTTLGDGAYVPKRVKEEIDFDGPIERGAKKMRAQRVQEFLTLNGFAVSIDGDFGPATEKRVRDFQTASGLPATGVVDMTTHEELVAPIVKALNPIAAGGKSLSTLAAAYAKQHIKNHPKDSDHAPPALEHCDTGVQGSRKSYSEVRFAALSRGPAWTPLSLKDAPKAAILRLT